MRYISMHASECPEICLSDLGVWRCLGDVWGQGTLWGQAHQTEPASTGACLWQAMLGNA